MEIKQKKDDIENLLNNTIKRSPSHSFQYGDGVKEFQEQVEAIRKENFDLKLRNYLLREKIPSYNPSSNQQQQILLKENIDLKVDNEVLRKELEEEHSLLCEAGKIIEFMEQQQKLSEIQNQAKIDELNEKIQYLESENLELETQNYINNEKLIEFRNNVNDIRKIEELESCLKQCEAKNKELLTRIKEMEVLINRKDFQINELKAKLKQKISKF